MRTRRLLTLLIVILIIGAMIGYWSFSNKPFEPQPDMSPDGPGNITVLWQQPYYFDKQGYEPGIAMDSTGAMYYTAHKNLDDTTSWDYLASWFLVSRNDGATWYSPTDPFPLGRKWQTYLGDEGDIAVDANDNVYFVDTYLTDNHMHVWADQGTWQYSLRVQKSGGLDDRPWIAAQGDSILHYLGNNGVPINGGRYWYYRSTNGGYTWERSIPVPGNGWCLVDAERYGDHAYIITETAVRGEADLLLYVSNDRGVSWNWDNPITIGHRDGPGRQYPIVSAGDNGTVFALWNDATDGVENGTKIFVGWSDDYGQTWNSTNITPFKGFFDYPAMNIGLDGTLGVAFYATDDLPVSDDSEWYIYGGLQKDAIEDPINMNFSIADPDPVYVGSDLHALHDFFEIVVGLDGSINIAYQYYIGPENGHSELYFVRGKLPELNQTLE